MAAWKAPWKRREGLEVGSRTWLTLKQPCDRGLYVTSLGLMSLKQA